jgi:hypothetical protein
MTFIFSVIPASPAGRQGFRISGKTRFRIGVRNDNYFIRNYNKPRHKRMQRGFSANIYVKNKFTALYLPFAKAAA